MNLRPYAAGIFISIGTFVSGIMWWQHAHRPAHIAAEDIAALAADAWVRHAVSYTIGNQPPIVAWTNIPMPWHMLILPYSNQVSSIRLRDLVAKTSYSLKTHFWPRFPGYLAPYAHWLEPPWDDSIPLITGGYTYTNELSSSFGITNRIWSASTYTATGTVTQTIDTRIRDDHYVTDGYFHEPHMPGLTEFAIYGVSNAVDALPSWWTRNISTNLYLIDHFETYTNLTTKPRRWQITTNTLNALCHITTNITSAIMIASARFDQWSLWPATGIVTRSASGVAQRHASFHIRTNEYLFIYLEEEKSAHWQDFATALEATRTTSLATNVLPGRLVYLYYSGASETDSRTYLRSYNEYIDFTHDYDGSFSSGTGTTRYLGVKSSWPPQWAYSSGIVARVRYYGVFANYDGGEMLPLQIKRESDFANVTSFSAYSLPVPTSRFRGTDPFCGYTLCDMFGGWEQTFASTPAITDRFANNHKPINAAVWKLHLLIDIPSPSAPPVIDIGPDVFDILSLEDTDRKATTYLTTHVNYSPGNDNYRNYTESRSLNTHTLTLLALICVADFSFPDHSRGGTAAPHTPPWATNHPALTP